MWFFFFFYVIFLLALPTTTSNEKDRFLLHKLYDHQDHLLLLNNINNDNINSIFQNTQKFINTYDRTRRNLIEKHIKIHKIEFNKTYFYSFVNWNRSTFKNLQFSPIYNIIARCLVARCLTSYRGVNGMCW